MWWATHHPGLCRFVLQFYFDLLTMLVNRRTQVSCSECCLLRLVERSLNLTQPAALLIFAWTTENLYSIYCLWSRVQYIENYVLFWLLHSWIVTVAYCQKYDHYAQNLYLTTSTVEFTEQSCSLLGSALHWGMRSRKMLMGYPECGLRHFVLNFAPTRCFVNSRRSGPPYGTFVKCDKLFWYNVFLTCSLSCESTGTLAKL